MSDEGECPKSRTCHRTCVVLGSLMNRLLGPDTIPKIECTPSYLHLKDGDLRGVGLAEMNKGRSTLLYFFFRVPHVQKSAYRRTKSLKSDPV